MKNNRWLILTLTVLFLLPLFGGCSPEKEDAALEYAAPEENVQGDYRFTFVCPIMENVYWQDCLKGVRRADAELGTHTDFIGPETADNFDQEIIGYMEQAIAARPAGIMVYGGIEAMHPLIDQAMDSGIPVLTVDNDAPGTSRVAYVGTEHYEMGYQCGRTMLELTGGAGKIGYICSTFSAEGEAVIYGAFLDAIQDYNMEVVAQGEGFVDIDYCTSLVEQMLTEHPEITAIFCTGGYDVTGAAAAKVALGRDDLVLVGTDDVEENLAYVRSGDIGGLLAQDPEQMGYQAVHRLKEYLDKGSLPRDEYFTESIVVTGSNVDTYKFAEPSIEPESKTIRVGYYTDESPFQSGFSDTERKSGYAYEYYQAIATLAGWRYEYIYGSRDEILDKLIRGEVDIMAGVHRTSLRSGQAYFSQYDMGLDGAKRYFVVSKQREDLLIDLNYAMNQIQKTSPAFLTDLYQKYYSNAIQQPVTTWEREWLNQKGTLRMGYVRGAMPFSDQGEDGGPDGLAKNLVEQFSQYLQTTIEPVYCENISALQDALSGGEIDVAFPMYSDEWLWESKGFRQTESFINDRVMVIYAGEYAGSLADRVALSRTGIGQRYYMSTYYPDSSITFYDGWDEALKAVQSGKEQCIIACASILQRYLTAHPEGKSLNIAYLDTAENFGMAVREEDSLLAGILNKAIRQMDQATITSALVRYSGVDYQYSLTEIVQRYAIPIIAILCLIFGVLLWLFVSYRFSVRRFNEKQAESQKALEEALEAADLASQAKTTFLSSMSHDIRTPMNAIVGMTSIAARHLDDRERVEDCLNKISLSSHHLLTLINDVLDISKIESGKLSLNPVIFSLRDSVTTLVNMIQPHVRAKKLEFEAHISGMEQEILYADEVRVNQIFINLLSNAVKYTPEGGSVSMRLSERVMPDGESVQLTYVVSDTGIGMAPEFMENMYQTFSRAVDGRVNKIQGTGLGLAIVKQMVDIMGGTIQCQSEVNRGTTFTVVLELPVGAPPAEQPPLPAGIRILLVDDDELFRESAAEVLESIGVTTDLAEGGAVAVEMVRSALAADKPYPVVIVDWKMPGMNGLETIRAIRKMTGDKVSVILASAYDWADIEEEAGRSGVDGFISKPLFRSYIYERLREVLRLDEETQSDEAEPADFFVGKRLLVAEDNELNWEVISELLSVYGIEADWAENGRICVDMLRKATPGTWDLVLMDIQMPEMNGLDATREIRASERADLLAIPILAMTADAFAEDITASIEAGMNGHVSKPVEIDRLLQELKRLL